MHGRDGVSVLLDLSRDAILMKLGLLETGSAGELGETTPTQHLLGRYHGIGCVSIISMRKQVAGDNSLVWLPNNGAVLDLTSHFC